MACLDTTVLLDLAGRGGAERRRHAEAVIRRLIELHENLVTTRLNVAELWVGVERSTRRDAELTRVERILAPLGVLEFDDAAARIFGRLTAHLQSIGRPVGDMDVLIASVAVAHGEILVTDNRTHFDNIPGIRLAAY